MSNNRYITNECRDAIAEWVLCHCPCALEDKEFIRGLFFLTDEAIREAVEKEREARLASLRRQQKWSQ